MKDNVAKISTPELLKRDGLSPRWLIVATLLATIAIVSRGPDMFRHPEFFAEDGIICYAQAYNGGWLHSLGIPYMGYLIIVQRLGAGLAMLVPFRWAALPMALTGLFFQVLPVPLVLSSRCRRWSPLATRLAFAIAYVGIPDAREIHVVCTNSQWHLALVMVILAFAVPPETLAGKIFDIVPISLGALSGPFVILLLPLAAVYWYVRRQRWSAVTLAVMALWTTTQLIVILLHYSQRSKGYLGASLRLFVKLLGGNAFIGALLGSQPFGLILPSLYSLGMFLIGIALCIYCAKSLRIEVRLFFVYCFLIFLAGIRAPAVRDTTWPLWPVLLQVPSLRYFFFPSLALLFSILWCAGFARNRFARVAGVALALVLCVGIYSDWCIPPKPFIDMPRQSEILKEARPGERVAIAVNPPGWYMELIKK